MNILLDTNVLIAAFISRGSCNELLEHVVRYHRLVLSKYILSFRCYLDFLPFGYGVYIVCG